MRILGLLVLLCGVCSAGDAVRQSASPQAAVNSFSPDVSASGIVRPFSLALDDRSRADSEHDGDLTCYTMHTFLVKREGPHSDVTEPVGQSTCLAGSRYNVRKVEGPGKAPAR
jgi:hypothetical protein